MKRFQRSLEQSLAVLTLLSLSACGQESSPTAPSGPTSFLTGTWTGNRDDPGQSRRPQPSSAFEWANDVDLRSGAADQSTDLPRDGSLHASVADDGDDGLNGPDTWECASGANQHSGGVHVAARPSRNLWKQRDRPSHADRGKSHRDGLPTGDVRRPGRAHEAVTVRAWPRSIARRLSVFSKRHSSRRTGQRSF